MPFLECPNFALDDSFLVDKIKEIIVEHKIERVIETGINEGKSTYVLSQIARWVIGIDIDPICIESAHRLLTSKKVGNYSLRLGHSPDILKWYSRKVDVSKTLFFLDAHWGEAPWPLPDEINAIPRGKGILIFHDIQVPNKDFGFDYYVVDGHYIPFSISLVEDQLKEWSSTWRVEYNEQANGSYRGVCFIYPE